MAKLTHRLTRDELAQLAALGNPWANIQYIPLSNSYYALDDRFPCKSLEEAVQLRDEILERKRKKVA